MSEETEIYDFGFSIQSEDDVKKMEKEALNLKTNELTETQRKLIGLKNMIWPLLQGLKKDPFKAYIWWPNRTEKVNDFQKRIEDFIQENR